MLGLPGAEGTNGVDVDTMVEFVFTMFDTWLMKGQNPTAAAKIYAFTILVLKTSLLWMTSSSVMLHALYVLYLM